MKYFLLILIVISIVVILTYKKQPKKNWKNIPDKFVNEIIIRVGERDFSLMTDLLLKYNAFNQQFFQEQERLNEDINFNVNMFANFLGNMAIQLSKHNENIKDIEKLLRLSIKINSNEYGSRAALAFLLANDGRYEESVKEAKIALQGFEKLNKNVEVKKAWKKSKHYDENEENEMVKSLKQIIQQYENKISVIRNLNNLTMELSSEAPEEGIYLAINTAFYSYFLKWKDENPNGDERRGITEAIIFALKTRYPNWSDKKISDFIKDKGSMKDITCAVIKMETPQYYQRFLDKFIHQTKPKVIDKPKYQNLLKNLQN